MVGDVDLSASWKSTDHVQPAPEETNDSNPPSSSQVVWVSLRLRRMTSPLSNAKIADGLHAPRPGGKATTEQHRSNFQPQPSNLRLQAPPVFNITRSDPDNFASTPGPR